MAEKQDGSTMIIEGPPRPPKYKEIYVYFAMCSIYMKNQLFIFTSPPIGGGRGIVMPMSVCLFVCVCVCVCVCVFVRVFAKFQSVISQSFLNRSS